MCTGLKEKMEYCRGPNGRAGLQVVDVSLVLSESGRAADDNDEIPEVSGGGIGGMAEANPPLPFADSKSVPCLHLRA